MNSQESDLPGEVVRRLSDDTVSLVDSGSGASWYAEYRNDVDVAVINLCRLRRAGAADKGRPDAGDDAVRKALGRAKPQAVIWLASRAISYMDEHGFPETMAPWLDE